MVFILDYTAFLSVKVVAFLDPANEVKKLNTITHTEWVSRRNDRKVPETTGKDRKRPEMTRNDRK